MSTDIHKVTDNRPEAFFELLKERAHELCPDYPFVQEDAFEWLWAITSSLEGTNMACDDWYEHYQKLKDAIEDKLAFSEDRRVDGWLQEALQWKMPDRPVVEQRDDFHQQLLELKKAAELAMGDWANVKSRDRLREVLNRTLKAT